MQKKYMLDSNSFMPVAAIACIVAGGIFVALIRSWSWGVLSVPSGVMLILAAATTAVFIVLIIFRLVSGLLMLIPAGLTAFAFLLHTINMILIKGSFDLRIELLLFVLFTAMLLIMVASLSGRKNLDRKKTLIICAVMGFVALVSCFIPLFLADNAEMAFFELLETSLPLILYFAAFICYFAGIEVKSSEPTQTGERNVF